MAEKRNIRYIRYKNVEGLKDRCECGHIRFVHTEEKGPCMAGIPGHFGAKHPLRCPCTSFKKR